MKSKICDVIIGLFALAVIQPAVQAGGFHFSGGLTYVNGVTKTVDILQSLYESAGYTFDKSFEIPVGPSLDPVLRIRLGRRRGL